MGEELDKLSLLELKGKAYDLGKKLNNMQQEANEIGQGLNMLNQEIQKREKIKPVGPSK